MLRWWYQRQTAQLATEAERIREGLLQELFVVRRSLELALMSDQTETATVQQWLTQMETIQHSLETVMHRLAPPFLGDSLPLALQHCLKEWQVEHPAVLLTVALPEEWRQEPIEQRRLFVSVLQVLLHLLSPYVRSEAVLHVSLTQQATIGQLVIQLTAPTVSELLSGQATAFTNLQQFFQVLAEGKCYCRRQASTVTWCYQWRSSRAQ